MFLVGHGWSHADQGCWNRGACGRGEKGDAAIFWINKRKTDRPRCVPDIPWPESPGVIGRKGIEGLFRRPEFSAAAGLGAVGGPKSAGLGRRGSASAIAGSGSSGLIVGVPSGRNSPTSISICVNASPTPGSSR